MHQMHLQLLFSPFVTVVVVGSLVEVRIFYMDGKRQSIKLAFWQLLLSPLSPPPPPFLCKLLPDVEMH